MRRLRTQEKSKYSFPELVRKFVQDTPPWERAIQDAARNALLKGWHFGGEALDWFLTEVAGRPSAAIGSALAESREKAKQDLKRYGIKENVEVWQFPISQKKGVPPSPTEIAEELRDMARAVLKGFLKPPQAPLMIQLVIQISPLLYKFIIPKVILVRIVFCFIKKILSLVNNIKIRCVSGV